MGAVQPAARPARPSGVSGHWAGTLLRCSRAPRCAGTATSWTSRIPAQQGPAATGAPAPWPAPCTAVLAPATPHSVRALRRLRRRTRGRLDPVACLRSHAGAREGTPAPVRRPGSAPDGARPGRSGPVGNDPRSHPGALCPRGGRHPPAAECAATPKTSGWRAARLPPGPARSNPSARNPLRIPPPRSPARPFGLHRCPASAEKGARPQAVWAGRWREPGLTVPSART